MPDDVRERKFGAVFDWFDQDGDRFLTKDDFQALAALFERAAPADRGAAAGAIREGFDEWWRLLLAHGDRDGEERIDPQEFAALMFSDITADGNFDATVVKIADGFLDALDTNGDGVLDIEEYVRLFDIVGVPPTASGEAFRRLDRDGNGVISRDEFRLAIREFYLSGDEDAPGNWLLGPLDRAA
ncbi:EF-hand domain-containing protein [Streptomyces sp. NPDC052077]|uniref:EF-hand domain-containing protein n=1 Tax=Streptomyces sp. NPDC052077 TaxID=3154757 RepID=UPI003434EB77